MFAIEENDQKQLISASMIVDQFIQIFFNIEASFIDEDSKMTFNIVNLSLTIPEHIFKQKISSVENVYNLINPVFSSMQSNFIKNILIRHLAGFIFAITRF